MALVRRSRRPSRSSRRHLAWVSATRSRVRRATSVRNTSGLAADKPNRTRRIFMRVGVLGIGKTPHKIQHAKSLRDLIVEAGRGAIADAGVSPSDIQMLYVGNVGSVGFNYENSTGLMAA